MNTMIKAILTAASIVAIAVLLMFWGKTESSANSVQQVAQTPFSLEWHYKPVW